MADSYFEKGKDFDEGVLGVGRASLLTQRQTGRTKLG